MPYAVTADLNLSDQRLIELTDSAAVPGVLDEDVLDARLVEAKSMVDSLLAPAGMGPYADGDVPPIITVITAWIWAYRLYRHREVMEIPQSIKDDYAMALQWLKDIVAGELAVDPEDEEAATAQVPTVLSSCPRGWTRRSETET